MQNDALDIPDNFGPDTPVEPGDDDFPVMQVNNAPQPNQSSWLINIGTHKKPADDEEFAILRASLNDAILRVLRDPRFARKCYYMVRKPVVNRPVTAYRDRVFRTQQFLQIVWQRADHVIEIGAVQHRVDAHVLLNVGHWGAIQFDHHGFQEMLDAELELENQFFEIRNIPNKNPRRIAVQPWLRWAEPNLYVSFRTIGKIDLMNAHRYMNKIFASGKEYPQDRAALYPLAQSTALQPRPVATGTVPAHIPDVNA